MKTQNETEDYAKQQAISQLESIKEMLAAFNNGANDGEIEEARERIQEDPLSVEVRSGWVSCGSTMEAEEYCILLCAGGPAVRIIGELDQYKQASSARLQYQDWGTPWAESITTGEDHDALVEYANHFFFGE